MIRAALLASTVIALSTVSPAAADVVTGAGSAPISKNVESVRALAEQAARQDLVKSMARSVIGAERLQELQPSLIDQLARQIRDDMITQRSAERIGKEYKISVTADIDRAWFQQLLDDQGIRTSIDYAGGSKQAIFVMIDERTGVARDTDKPAEVVVEYDRQIGSNFSDTSYASASQKSRSASTLQASAASKQSSAYAAAASERGQSAAQYKASGAASRQAAGAASSQGSSGQYAEQAAMAHSASGAQASSHQSASAVKAQSASASASSVKAASASSYDASAVDRKNVKSSTHDNTRFRHRITYQSNDKNGPSDVARRALNDNLQNYDITVAASELALNSFFQGKQISYDELKSGPQFGPFLNYLGQQNIAPFFMGGTMDLRDSGRDAATGRATCSGSFSASAYAVSNSHELASATANGSSSGSTYEDCTSTLARSLARQVGADVGPKVQRYWRDQMREKAQKVSAATQAADYTLVVRGTSLPLSVQADLFDALGTVPGLQNPVFLEQNDRQIAVQVTYGGSVPLPLALFQKLRANPAFANMQQKADGQQIILCLSGC